MSKPTQERLRELVAFLRKQAKDARDMAAAFAEEPPEKVRNYEDAADVIEGRLEGAE